VLLGLLAAEAFVLMLAVAYKGTGILNREFGELMVGLLFLSLILAAYAAITPGLDPERPKKKNEEKVARS